MSIQLDQTVPVRPFVARVRIDVLASASDRRCRILDCAAGPASFNAELTAAGGTGLLVRPTVSIHRTIQRQFSTLDHVIEQVRATPQNCLDVSSRPGGICDGTGSQSWTPLSPITARRGTDLSVVPCRLPFRRAFDLCPRPIFCFCTQTTSPDVSRDSVRALMRVAREVRIFPLIALRAERSQHLEPVCNQLQTRWVPSLDQQVG